MNEERREALDATLRELETYQSALVNQKECRNEVCGTLHLGALTRTMYRLKLLGASSETCFNTFSLQEAVCNIESMECPPSPSKSKTHIRCRPDIDMHATKQTIIDRIGSKMNGLELGDFTRLLTPSEHIERRVGEDLLLVDYGRKPDLRGRRNVTAYNKRQAGKETYV